MDEALILKRLDSISEEIRSLKSDVLQELKEDLAPVIKQATPHVVSFLSDVEGQYSNEELANLIKNMLTNIGNLNSLLDMLKAGMELKDDLGPVSKHTLPKVTEFMAELDGFKPETLAEVQVSVGGSATANFVMYPEDFTEAITVRTGSPAAAMAPWLNSEFHWIEISGFRCPHDPHKESL